MQPKVHGLNKKKNDNAISYEDYNEHFGTHKFASGDLKGSINDSPTEDDPYAMKAHRQSSGAQRYMEARASMD